MTKKFNIFCFFFLIFCLFKAQINYSWFPVKPGIQYNFKIDSASTPVSDCIKIDSANGNPLSYHLNKIVTRCDTCKGYKLVNDFFDSTYVLNAQPQFLQHLFFLLSDTLFYFKGLRSFALKPFAVIGSSWIYDSVANVTAQIIMRNTGVVLSALDSLCYIKLSTNDTIILSKDHGLIQFPYKTVAQHRYKLVGMEGNTNAGLSIKRFHDFFNFNTGDVFQFEFTDFDFNLLPPMLKGGHERWDVQTTQAFQDSLCSTIKRTYFDSVKYGASAPVITSFTDVVQYTFKDSAEHLANLLPHQQLMVNPFYIYNNGIYAIHKVAYSKDQDGRNEKSFGQNCPNTNLTNGNTGAAEKTNFERVYLNRNRTKIVGRKIAEGLGFTSELFNDGDRIYERCLIGYIKGTDTSGTIYNADPVLVRQQNRDPKIILYPNPAGKIVFIYGEMEQNFRVQLFDTLGQTLLETNNMKEIDISDLQAGIYFVRISCGNFTQDQKLIVSH